MSSAHDRAVLNQILNPLMPTSDSGPGDVHLEADTVDHPQYTESQQLEKEGVALAEGGKVREALEKFSEAISTCPLNPSAYNNRAQAYRLSQQPDEALEDLNEALRLAGAKSRTACQAYVQRASIWRLQGDDEKARADFAAAAELGSSFAKMQLVALNPYAAMCNKMLAEVFEKVKTGKD
uniref:TPR_REGION domain-containing protein n=1 Tax=Caenorhabditis japonica TaxID=281687 RepID=A0A8R1HNA9_CAEJA